MRQQCCLRWGTALQYLTSGRDYRSYSSSIWNCSSGWASHKSKTAGVKAPAVSMLEVSRYTRIIPLPCHPWHLLSIPSPQIECLDLIQIREDDFRYRRWFHLNHLTELIQHGRNVTGACRSPVLLTKRSISFGKDSILRLIKFNVRQSKNNDLSKCAEILRLSVPTDSSQSKT